MAVETRTWIGRDVKRREDPALLTGSATFTNDLNPPGMLITATELLERNPQPDEQEIRSALSGNLCRCTGYGKIFEAVRLAAARV